MNRWPRFRALVVLAGIVWVAFLASAVAEDLRSEAGHGRETVPQQPGLSTPPPLDDGIVLGEGLPSPPRTPTEWRKTLAEWRRRIDPTALPQDNPEGETAKGRIRAIRDPNAIPALQAAFAAEKNHNVRLVYLEALGRIEGPKTLKLLVDVASTHPSEPERQLAAKLLGELPDRRGAIPPLIKYLRSPAYSAYAAEALSRSGLTQSQSRSEPPDPALTTGLIDALVLVGTRLEPTSVQRWHIGGGSQHAHGYTTHRIWVRVHFPIPNEAALEALKEYAGEDCGYDQQAWRQWLQSTAIRGEKRP